MKLLKTQLNDTGEELLTMQTQLNYSKQAIQLLQAQTNASTEDTLHLLHNLRQQTLNIEEHVRN